MSYVANGTEHNPQGFHFDSKPVFYGLAVVFLGPDLMNIGPRRKNSSQTFKQWPGTQKLSMLESTFGDQM